MAALKQLFLSAIILMLGANVFAQNVGIGTTSPKRTFVVKNASTDSNAVVTELASSNGDPNFHLVTTKGDSTNTTNSVVAKIGLLYGDDNANFNSFLRFHRGGGTSGGYMSFSTDKDIERMRISSGGNVGIGTTTPAHKLDIAGDVRIADGTQGNGKVLTSDSTGAASWQGSINFRAHGIKNANYGTEKYLDSTNGFQNIDYENNSTIPIAASNWDTGLDAYIIPVTGLYHIDYQIGINGTSSVENISGQIYLRVDSTDEAIAYADLNRTDDNGFANNGFRASMSISTDLFCTAGDIVRFKIGTLLASSGGASINTANNSTVDYFDIHLVR